MQFLLVMMERIPSMRRYGERIQKEDFWQKQEAATRPSVFVYGKDKLNVFESAIDAMSYASMVLEGGEDWTQQTYLSLGGVYKNNQNRLPIALEKYLSEHGEPQEIILRLDHDEVGSNATKDIL